ncbi:Gfo/Idh/MocA family protein [Cohnella sp. REN36]|uniref:Gfo/Idh/MocA family protein n=1 Tax=Cohnella sp. REN36 TaxID=2887347 RepID=UPI001D13A45F|nr:Gfo/Idh/MocA family oxidoreductase [Cohnella sp. REN36]MCC3375253.1 Gfo/Idh/MocA family oxidoreductase [Cohnella sp. REN36]
MKPITAVLLGAGSRGRYIYGPYAEKYPNDLRIVAVAEPDEMRRRQFAEKHGIGEDNAFASWERVFEQGRIADAMIVSTLDRMHYAPTMKALALGYHVLLEKPMSPDPTECVRLSQASSAGGRLLVVSHVLRYSPFWAGIKRTIEAGEIGKIAGIQLTENVGYRHMTHSYVRGNWRKSAETSPMILAKSCHDLDILSWLMDEPCISVSSFGSLLHFRAEHAPEGATDRCIDGCAVERDCPFSALRLYRQPPDHPWARYITGDLSPEGIDKALREGSFGRCVYRCDNDVVDHQVVSLSFASGASATFTMSGFTEGGSRRVQIMGTRGEITGDMEEGTFTLYRFSTGERVEVRCGVAGDGHGGGDEVMVGAFVKHVREFERSAAAGLTSASASLQSHLMAFAAERSRLNGGQAVRIPEMIEALEAGGQPDADGELPK